MKFLRSRIENVRINNEDYKLLAKYFICLRKSQNIFQWHEISKQEYAKAKEKLDETNKFFNYYLMKQYFIILNRQEIPINFDVYNVLKDNSVNNRLHYIERRYSFKESFDEIINNNQLAIINYMTLQEKNPETIIIEREDFNILIDKIKKILSKNQFKIFWQRFIQGKSCKEIAIKEGVTIRDIQINISRILKKIKKIL